MYSRESWIAIHLLSVGSITSKEIYAKQNQPRSIEKAKAFCSVSLTLYADGIAGLGSSGRMMVAHIAFGRLNSNAKAQVLKLLAVTVRPPDA